ncbi:MAG: hypothetical protein RL708_490, partial [Bacteroidota bacterium]
MILLMEAKMNLEFTKTIINIAFT